MPFVRFFASRSVAASVTVVLAGCSTLNQPTGAIEKKYFAMGPWAVTVKPAGECCDSKGNPLDLYFPTNLGANGFHHPIVTWANGTNTLPRGYDYFLRHLASWGFFVVATEDLDTGTGQTVLDAAPT
jgi:predicted dienelactone hydrolase